MKKLILALLTIVSFQTSTAKANTLFEGWFEVFLGAKKIGYMVERYEFVDNKFKAVTYLKTGPEAGNMTESLKAFAGPDLAPLNYSYTAKTGDDIKIIDATFKGDLMTLKTNDGKKEKKDTKRIKKGTFLSTFLLYLILQNGGLSVGKSYTYSAIAEEDGVAYVGKANIASKDKVKGRDAVKINNKFKDESFFSWVSPKAEFLLTRSPAKNIEVRFSENQAEATKGMSVDLAALKLLFNKIPGDMTSGTVTPATAEKPTSENGEQVIGAGSGKGAPVETPAIDEKKKKLFKKEAPESKGKQSGVPGGEGIEIKGVPPPQSN